MKFSKTNTGLRVQRTRGDFAHVGRPSAKVACCTTTCCVFLITAAIGGVAGLIYGFAGSRNEEQVSFWGCVFTSLAFGFIGVIAGGAVGLLAMKFLPF